MARWRGGVALTRRPSAPQVRQGTSTKLDAALLPGASGRIETEAKCAFASRPTVNTKKWGGGAAHKDRGRTDTSVKPPPAAAPPKPPKQQRPAALRNREVAGGEGDSASPGAAMAPSAAPPASAPADAASHVAAGLDPPGEAAVSTGEVEAAESDAAAVLGTSVEIVSPLGSCSTSGAAG